MAFERLDVLPLAVFILFPATFLATYIIAVLLGHVEPDFPYISDTGTYSPESCIFGQLLNVGTLLLGLVIYVRYRQVAEYYSSYSLSPAVLSLNKMGVWFGLLSCLGLSFVANFQETNVITVHLTGAFLCFGFGTVYFWIHAVCSYHMQPLANSLQLAHLRLALAVICTVFFILLSITGVLSHIQFRGSNPRKWYPNDGGWQLHVISTASEWVVAVAFCIYILSFAREFRNISLESRVYLNVESGGFSVADSECSPVLPHAAVPEGVVIVRQGGNSIIT